MCEYTFRDETRCKEETVPNGKFCILHTDFPSHGEDRDIQRMDARKHKKVVRKQLRGDHNFQGAKLRGFAEIMDIKKDIDLRDAVIEEDVWFSGARISGNTGVLLDGARIGGSVWFNKATIDRWARFSETKVGGSVFFNGAVIGGSAWFVGAEIGESVFFEDAKIEGAARFENAKIGSSAIFNGAEIGGPVLFDGAEVKRGLYFHRTKFKEPVSQELACRTAKVLLEEIGDRSGADYHYYREMEARRKKKHRLAQYLELPIQYCFGYGVYPLRVLVTWLSIIALFAFVYWIGNGIEGVSFPMECVYFSIVNAATPGYGGYKPKPAFQAVAGLQAILGTLMWATFIATFARKYMR